MDLNNDGHPDILSGSYSAHEIDGMAGLFQVLWGSEKGFQKATPLKGTDDKPLLIGDPSNDDTVTERICTRPTAVDWDSDGDLDLLVGNFKGSLFLFRGEGNGQFNPKSEDLKLTINGYHSDPFCIDIDADGDLDILSGNANGGAQWAENTAGPGKEITVTEFRELIPGQHRSEPVWGDRDPAPAGSTRVWADDLNGDGKLDILLGDSTTIKTPAQGLTREQVTQAEKNWSTKMSAMQEKLRAKEQSPEEEQKIMKEYRQLMTSRKDFITEERTGFVWLYLGK
ncbi:MAG: FG-GAP repeat domain-containing protein [Verrucomicrobiaceae bacterium]